MPRAAARRPRSTHGGAPPPDRRHMLAHGQSEALHTGRGDLPTMGRSHTCKGITQNVGAPPRHAVACEIRSTPRPHVGCNAPEHRRLCACTPEMDEPHTHALAPHVSRGYADQ